jgi:aspartate kinase
MIVAKFGGTCITPRNLKKVKNVVTTQHKAIVVSAIGKNFDKDTKVTDLLFQLHRKLPDTRTFSQIADKYRQLVRVNHINVDIDAILENTITDIVQQNSLDNTVSKGEEMSAKIVAAHLNLPYIEIEQLIVFSKGRLLLSRSAANIRRALADVPSCVIAGFYGSEQGMRKVFGRGGSDITGAVVANAVGASVYENWTDVDGFFVANPRTIPHPPLVHCLSYPEMYLLAKLGATVLHPDSVRPTQVAGIPIHVRNIYNPDGCGTLVTTQSGKGQILGVFEKRDGNSISTDILFTSQLNDVVNLLLYSACTAHAEILSLTTHGEVLTVHTTAPIAKPLVAAMQQRNIINDP